MRKGRGMKENVRRVLEKNFQIKEYEGTDKVCDLGEAIRKNVKPLKFATKLTH